MFNKNANYMPITDENQVSLHLPRIVNDLLISVLNGMIFHLSLSII